MKKPSCLRIILIITIIILATYITLLFKIDLITQIGITAYLRIKQKLLFSLLFWLFPIVMIEYFIGEIDKSHLPTYMHSRIKRYAALIAVKLICSLPMLLYLNNHLTNIPELSSHSHSPLKPLDLLILAGFNIPIAVTITAIVLGLLNVLLTIAIFIRGLNKHDSIRISILLILLFVFIQLLFSGFMILSNFRFSTFIAVPLSMIFNAILKSSIQKLYKVKHPVQSL